MTQEDKARAYDEALKDMRVIYPNLRGDTKLAVEHAFPQLAESEDERMRMALIKLMTVAGESYVMSATGFKKERLLAYLEKQKEQKPVEHSAKGRRGRMGGMPEYVRRKAEAFKDKMEPPYDADDICTAYEAGALESANPAELEQLAKLREMTHEIRDAYERGIEVGRVESKQEWSEEDEKVRNAILGFLNPDKGGTKYLSNAELVKWSNWLKSLRPSWKPSEEQMEALERTIQLANFGCGEDRRKALVSLHAELKKLI